MNMKAFTLTELIVLVAIVAISAAILAPAVGQAGITPNQLICQANLRAIGMCNSLYADEHNDCLPVASADYDPSRLPPGDMISRYMWMHLLSGYAGQQTHQDYSTHPTYTEYPAIFHSCPDYAFRYYWNPGYGMIVPIYELGAFAHVNRYSYNGNPWGMNIPYGFCRRSSFSYTAQRAWMGESAYLETGGDPSQTIYDPAQRMFPGLVPGNDPWMPSDPQRHGDSANYLFMDGHVELLRDNVGGWAFSDYTKMLYPGDFSGDGVVNQGDYTVWADSYGQTGQGWPADANHDGVVDQGDYTTWADHFGEVQP